MKKEMAGPQKYLKSFLGLFIFVLVMLAFMAIMPAEVYANEPASEVVINGETLDSENPYLVNGVKSATGVLGAGGCTAEFDSATGTLRLRNYSGSGIYVPGQGNDEKNLTIVLEGYNQIELTTQSEQALGIRNSTAGDLRITSDEPASLAINIRSVDNSASGLYTGVQPLENGTVTIDGEAVVMVTATTENDKQANINAHGITAHNVKILNKASFSAVCKTESINLIDLASFANGIYAAKTVEINTTGIVFLDCSYENNKNGRGIYTDPAGDPIELKKVGKLTIKWTGLSSMWGVNGTMNYEESDFEVIRDENAKTATYRYRDGSFEVTGITVSPQNPTVHKGKSVQFTATVTGNGDFNNTVEWEVEGGTPLTYISDAGKLKISRTETASTLTVRATARGDRSKKVTTTVNVAEAIPTFEYIYFGNTVYLDERKPYLINGTPFANGELGEGGCTAYFDVENETLYLKNYDGAGFSPSGTTERASLTVKLIGNNTITDSIKGISYPVDPIDLTISSEDHASLTINISGDGNPAGILLKTSESSLTLEGKAHLFVNAKSSDSDGYVTGIEAYDISILDNASYKAQCNHDKTYGKVYGISVYGETIINSSGDVYIDCGGNSSSSYPVYNIHSEDDFNLQKVGEMTLMWPKTGMPSGLYYPNKLVYDSSLFEVIKKEESDKKIEIYRFVSGSELYSITVQDASHGGGYAIPPQAMAGTTVTLVPQPNDGYQLKKWDILSANPGLTEITGNSFILLPGDVELWPVFEMVSVTGVSLNETSLTLEVGDSETLIATVLPFNAYDKRVTWQVSDWDVIVFNTTSGKVTAIKAGTSTITVTTEEGGYTATCEVTVTDSTPPVVNVTGVTLDKASLSLEVGNSETLVATVAPDNADNKNVTWSSSNASVATVDSNGKVTAVAAGSATITVTTEDGGYTATCAVTVTSPTVSVTGVTLDKASLSLEVGNSETLVATVAPDNADNKNVTWSSSNASVATVDSNGKVTAVAAGSATITVTTEDGGYTATCAVTVTSPTVSVTGVTLDKASLSLEVGNSETLVATVAPANADNKNVTWSSSDISVATVDSNGKVTAVAAGSATITVTTEDGGKTATCTVTVTDSTPPVVNVTGVTLNKTSLSLEVGNSETLVATVAPANADNKNVTWSSSDISVATVDSNGKVTAVAAGSATITVTTEDGGKTATCTVTVTSPTVSVTGVTLDKASLSLEVGNSETLVATVAPDNADNKNVTWSSSNASVATVDSNGKVTAVAAGSATITVTTEDGGYTATCAVTVTSPTVSVTGVTLDKASLSLEVGNSETLVATVAPDNADNKNVTWSSSNASVATVDSNGKVTAVAVGSATITVTTEDGGYTATCAVTVTSPTVSVTGVTLDKTSLSLEVGNSETLVATVAPDNADNKNVTWSSSNASVATVDSNGKVTAVAVGSATITVTTEDGGKTATCAVTVKKKSQGGGGTSTKPEPEEPQEPAEQEIPPAGEVGYLDIPAELLGSGSGVAVSYTNPNGNTEILAFGIVENGKMKYISKGDGKYEVIYNAQPFEDIAGHWAKDDIDFASARLLFNGVNTDMFNTEAPMTRGMFVTVLGRMYGVDTNKYAGSGFADVSQDQYYSPFIQWAAEEGIVFGVSENSFDPDRPVTRQEMAVIMMRYMDYLGINLPGKAGEFKDDEQIDAWAKDGVYAMREMGIIFGKPGNSFDPLADSTRAEVAAVLRRLIEFIVVNVE